MFNFIKKYIAYFLVFFYACLLLLNIGAIQTIVGDENTYVASTRSLLNAEVDNNLHPLLAKTIWLYFVYLGNGYFGTDSPLVWRLGTVLLSIGTLIVFFKICTHFLNKKNSLIATIILAIDPMYFSFSRLVQLEIPLSFFLVLSFYFLLRSDFKKFNYLVLSGLTIGLSLAVKLSSVGVFIAIILLLVVLIFIKQKKLIYIKNAIFYFSSGMFGFLLGNIIYIFMSAEKEKGLLIYLFDLFYLQATSTINIDKFQTSPVWSWFSIPQIISLYRLDFNTKVESIIAFQNPVIMVLTIFSLLVITKGLIEKKYNKLFLILIVYFSALIIPWFFGIHDTYYYYILPAIPFAVIMSIIILEKIKVKSLLPFVLIFSIILFVFYYPLLIGVPVKKNYDLYLYKYSQYKYPAFNTFFCQNCYPRK